MSHKCTCDWCPAYRDDLDAQTKGYDRALAELAEARAENERLRATIKGWENAVSVAHDNRKPLVTDMGHCAGCFGWHPHAHGPRCVVGEFLARPTGGPSDE